MTDNIKPEHYRTGEIDLYEAWYRTYPFNEYRSIMQAVAERYMRRDKIEHREKQEKPNGNKTLKDTFADLGKIFEGSNFDEWLRDKEDSESIDLLKTLLERGFDYIARDKDEKLWAYDAQPIKLHMMWTGVGDRWAERLGGSDYFPEVKWTDDEPTKISELLEIYSNGGENGKL